jgi:HEAT repeat protein
MKRLLVSAILCGLALVPAAQGQVGSYLGKDYFKWAAALSHKDASVRRSAAFALGKMGVGAQPAVGKLVKRLETDGDAGVREAAAAAIGDIVLEVRGGEKGLEVPRLLPIVQKALNDPDPRVQRSAAYAIGTMGGAAKPAADALMEVLKDNKKNACVRQNAAWALGQIGSEGGEQAAAALCEALGDRDPLVKRDAAGALGAVGRPAAVGAVGPLLDLVQREKDDVVLKTALDSLTHLVGEEHRKIPTESLEKLLTHPDEEVQRSAAFVLAGIGGDKAVPALPVLCKALKDDDVEVQGLAAAALAEIGEAAAPAVPDLARALRGSKDSKDATKDINVRRNAALALGHIGSGAKAAVPALAEALQPEVPVEVRRHAAEALALIRLPTTKDAVPAVLAAIARDTDPLVRQRCIWSLFEFRELGSAGQKDLLDRARPILSAVLEEKPDEHTLVRYDAARMLANSLGPEAPDRVVAVLMEMLTNKSLRVFDRTDATVSAGNEAARGTTRVQDKLGGDARYMAAQALGWLGEKARKRPDVIAALKAAAMDSDGKLKETARKALESLGVR